MLRFANDQRENDRVRIQTPSVPLQSLHSYPLQYRQKAAVSGDRQEQTRKYEGNLQVTAGRKSETWISSTSGTSLVFQWLPLCTPKAGVLGSTPGQGTWSHMPQLRPSTFQFSHSAVSDSLRRHGLQHAQLPCPSPTPRAYSNSCPLSQWCYPTISLSSPSPPAFNNSQH